MGGRRALPLQALISSTPTSAIPTNIIQSTGERKRMAKDLRTYLDQLVSTYPDALKVVDDEVDPVFEAAAIVHKMKNDPAYPQYPAVLFRNVKGSRIPLLLNLHGTFERVALSIDSNVKDM